MCHASQLNVLQPEFFLRDERKCVCVGGTCVCKWVIRCHIDLRLAMNGMSSVEKGESAVDIDRVRYTQNKNKLRIH